MNRCRHCLGKAELRNGHCSVCGIDPEKTPSELSGEEKKARFHARGILLVAAGHFIGTVCGLILAFQFPSPAPMLLLAGINLALGLGLARYSLWAYKGATVYYFLIGMVNVISIQQGPVHLAGIALALIALYLVGNGTSKAIFERRLPEMA
ncbi:hypothetical protein P4E94_03600 [Pontiellaceae bacterium B12219]|nr:hypothetical protein [Pontiellaceae bacterium B12219]